MCHEADNHFPVKLSFLDLDIPDEDVELNTPDKEADLDIPDKDEKNHANSCKKVLGQRRM